MKAEFYNGTLFWGDYYYRFRSIGHDSNQASNLEKIYWENKTDDGESRFKVWLTGAVNAITNVDEIIVNIRVIDRKTKKMYLEFFPIHITDISEEYEVFKHIGNKID